LDLRCLGVRLGIRVLRRDLSPDNVLAHIILLAQVEEPPDLRCTLGTEAFGEDVVSEAGDVVVALLDNRERDDGDIRTDDATAHGFALALTGALLVVAGMTLAEEETDTVGEEDTLLHREALLVVATSDAEDVALEFVAKGVGGDFLTHPLVVEDTVAALIFNVDEFLLPSGRVGDIELHG